MPEIYVKTWTANPVCVGDSVQLVRNYLSQRDIRLYDLAPVAQDNCIGPLEWWVPNFLGAGLTRKNVAQLQAASNPIASLLSQLPNHTSLYEQIEEQDWHIMACLFNEFLRIPGIDVARTTKILHKKRPRLIPPVDTQMAKKLGYEDTGESLVAVLKLIRHDLTRNLDCLRQTCALLPELEGITIVRTLDMILWQSRSQWCG
ncbi:MAG TPA: DUF6308 family protein [Verrucomicrobiae bacterium]|nr:DUF6308 family protein [Verrucomicrobiae bacterium]